MGPHCPTGVDWAVVSLPELGQSLGSSFRLVHRLTTAATATTTTTTGFVKM